MENSTIELSLEGDSSYRFAKNKNAVVSAPAVGLHEKIVVDAFPGENFSTLLPLDVYSENVYQGQLFAFVQLNRKSRLSLKLSYQISAMYVEMMFPCI